MRRLFLVSKKDLSPVSLSCIADGFGFHVSPIWMCTQRRSNLSISSFLSRIVGIVDRGRNSPNGWTLPPWDGKWNGKYFPKGKCLIILCLLLLLLQGKQRPPSWGFGVHFTRKEEERRNDCPISSLPWATTYNNVDDDDIDSKGLSSSSDYKRRRNSFRLEPTALFFFLFGAEKIVVVVGNRLEMLFGNG